MKICPNCNNKVSKFAIKKVYATMGKGKTYAGWMCNSCFDQLQEKLRKEHNNPNFFSDNIKDFPTGWGF